MKDGLEERLGKKHNGEPRDEGRLPSELKGEAKPPPGRTFSKEGLHIQGGHLREMEERSRKPGLGHRGMPVTSSCPARDPLSPLGPTFLTQRGFLHRVADGGSHALAPLH